MTEHITVEKRTINRQLDFSPDSLDSEMFALFDKVAATTESPVSVDDCFRLLDSVGPYGLFAVTKLTQGYLGAHSGAGIIEYLRGLEPKLAEKRVVESERGMDTGPELSTEEMYRRLSAFLLDKELIKDGFVKKNDVLEFFALYSEHVRCVEFITGGMSEPIEEYTALW